jgi:hypothetical protein
MTEPAIIPVEHQVVEIRVDNRLFSFAEGPTTGARLLELAGVALTNQLFLEQPGPGEDTPIEAHEEIIICAGMKFYAIPVGTFG